MQFHGWRGVVEVDTSQTPRIATKKAGDLHRRGAIKKEADLLKKLAENGVGYVPQLCESGEGWFSYPRIPGESFDKLFVTQTPKDKLQLITELIDKAYQLDKLGIVHGELDRPMSNVLINEDLLRQNKPSISIIDFERGHRQDYSGKNLRHMIQRLHRLQMISIEECKKFGTYDTDTLYQTLRMMLPKKQLSPLHQFLEGLLWCFLLVVGDQLSKRLLYDLAWGSTTIPFLTPAFNTGIGRSLPVPLWVTVSIACLTSGVILVRAKKQTYFPWRAIFLLAGARGNGFDRIFFGGVRDFIDLQYRPIFNLADIYLTIACLLLIWGERKKSSTLGAPKMFK